MESRCNLHFGGASVEFKNYKNSSFLKNIRNCARKKEYKSINILKDFSNFASETVIKY